MCIGSFSDVDLGINIYRSPVEQDIHLLQAHVGVDKNKLSNIISNGRRLKISRQFFSISKNSEI